jgi:hypothetical protein
MNGGYFHHLLVAAITEGLLYVASFLFLFFDFCFGMDFLSLFFQYYVGKMLTDW